MINCGVDVRSVVEGAPGLFAFEVVSEDSRMWDMHQRLPLGVIMERLVSVDANFWDPARVTRAVVNSKVSGPERIDLVQQATRLAVEAYAGTLGTDRIDRLSKRLGQLGMLKDSVEQTYDETTVAASKPPRSMAVAHWLADNIEGPLTIVPICHGGLVPALQGALYRQKLGEVPMDVYPVRHSRSKCLDHGPRIADEELEYLRCAAKDSTLVFYDDDSVSGTTMAKTTAYFKKRGIPRHKMTAVVNNDWRKTWRVNRQGRNWEKI